MTSIRLTKNKSLQKILDEIRELRFPLLNDTELVKAVLSEYYCHLIEAEEEVEWFMDEGPHPEFEGDGSIDLDLD